MKQLVILNEKTETAKANIVAKIEKKYPSLTDITIYGHRNIQISSEHFSIDMYADNTPRDRTREDYTPTYTEDKIRMNCKMTMEEIPTEAQAVAQVKAMHQERKHFIKAMEWVRDTILNDEKFELV